MASRKTCRVTDPAPRPEGRRRWSKPVPMVRKIVHFGAKGTDTTIQPPHAERNRHKCARLLTNSHPLLGL